MNNESKSIDESGLLELFEQITTWRRGDERAPHKPLLLLLALARLQRGEDRFWAYEEIDERLRGLLVDFGPRRKSYHPEYPFWRLQNDGLWEIPQKAVLLEEISDRKRSGDVPPTILRAHGAQGGFPREIHRYLSERPDMVNRIVTGVLVQNFPTSLHEDILDAVGMPWVAVAKRTPRDPDFRQLILRIYEYRCAVCGYDGRLGHANLGLEAAHVKWHAAGGPDQKDNGMALCAFHHKALDRGAIGLNDDRRILVSQDVHGGPSVEEWIIKFSGKALKGPQAGQPPPASQFIKWHQGEVFHQPARVFD